MAIDKFLGNSLITRLMASDISTLAELREAFVPQSAYGEGDWVDLAGMIVPKQAVADLMDAIENEEISDVEALHRRFCDLHSEYYRFEWHWVYKVLENYYGISLQEATIEQLSDLVIRWRDSVVGLDRMIYDDARKEFSLSSMTSFGADGSDKERKQDFMQVRGASFESDPFVRTVKEHIEVKSALGDAALARLASLK